MFVMPLPCSDNGFMLMGTTAVLFPVFTPHMVISQTLTCQSPLLFKFGLVFNIYQTTFGLLCLTDGSSDY